MLHLGPTLFLLYINGHLNDIIRNISIYADDNTLYSKCDWASDQWQQLELASEFKSYLQDTVDRDRKLLVGFDTGKTQRFSFDWSNTSGAI